MTVSQNPAAQTGDVHVALLRGINVGGRHKLPMKSLATMFVDTGCSRVQTYIQSGNVVFAAESELARRIPAIIADRIAADFGFTPPVMTRTAAELGEIIRGNPFLEQGVDKSSLHVAFLADLPDPARVAKLDPERSPGDTFIVRGREIYFSCPAGLARTKLSNTYFDSKLATISTMRNWRTTLKLLEMSAD